jgi:alkylated DNA repair dioxygenase AlkB
LLLTLKAKAERFAQSDFNSMVLLNYHRDGNDSVGWHAGDEPELGNRPVIASLSFGATRTSKLRNRRTGDGVKLPLTSESIVVARGYHAAPLGPPRAQGACQRGSNQSHFSFHRLTGRNAGLVV